MSITVSDHLHIQQQKSYNFVILNLHRSGTVNSNTVNSKFHLIRSGASPRATSY